MRHLALAEVLALHRLLIDETGGSDGIRDLGALESAVAQPRMSFGGDDLYPTLIDKAAALGYSLVMNHPFIDGNKRIGHAAIEALLRLNGFEIVAPVDEQEALFLSLAAGDTSRQRLTDWLETRARPLLGESPRPEEDES